MTTEQKVFPKRTDSEVWNKIRGSKDERNFNSAVRIISIGFAHTTLAFIDPGNSFARIDPNQNPTSLINAILNRSHVQADSPIADYVSEKVGFKIGKRVGFTEEEKVKSAKFLAENVMDILNNPQNAQEFALQAKLKILKRSIDEVQPAIMRYFSLDASKATSEVKTQNQSEDKSKSPESNLDDKVIEIVFSDESKKNLKEAPEALEINYWSFALSLSSFNPLHMDDLRSRLGKYIYSNDPVIVENKLKTAKTKIKAILFFKRLLPHLPVDRIQELVKLNEEKIEKIVEAFDLNFRNEVVLKDENACQKSNNLTDEQKTYELRENILTLHKNYGFSPETIAKYAESSPDWSLENVTKIIGSYTFNDEKRVVPIKK